MGIHQALIGSYTAAEVNTWSLVTSAIRSNGTSPTLTGLQTGDLLVHVQVATQFFTYSAPTGFTLAYDDTDNTPDLGISYRFHTTGTSYGVTFDGNADGGCVAAFRPSIPSGSPSLTPYLALEAKNGSPNHNTSLTYTQGELAVLVACLDDDNSVMSAPTGASTAAADGFTGGSAALGYANISTTGSYSWGSWTSSSDAWNSYVLRVSP